MAAHPNRKESKSQQERLRGPKPNSRLPARAIADISDDDEDASPSIKKLLDLDWACTNFSNAEAGELTGGNAAARRNLILMKVDFHWVVISILPYTIDLFLVKDKRLINQMSSSSPRIQFCGSMIASERDRLDLKELIETITNLSG